RRADPLGRARDVRARGRRARARARVRAGLPARARSRVVVHVHVVPWRSLVIRRPSSLVPVLAVVALVVAATPAAAGISLGSPSVDPEPNVTVVAGLPVKFLATGSFKPPDPSGSPWITFVWNFGDGTTQSTR